VKARVRRGEVLKAGGRGAEAVAAFEEAARLAPRAVEVLAGLAEAYEAVGAHERAIATAERARLVATDEGRANAVGEIERRLGEYRARVAEDRVGREP
jgi:tetratricopeptide (TPR) repeat protein